MYKHDDDMRQEMLAIQFVETCDRILKASGLDLKLKTYGCLSVGNQKGFIEWVTGTVSLSEICKPLGSAFTDSGDSRRWIPSSTSEDTDALKKPTHGLSNNSNSSEAFIRKGDWCRYESLRSLRQNTNFINEQGIGLIGNNPVQDFLRSNSYDTDQPYLIKKETMNNYVKSCAGYCVITYLLGVGDRHTDNLLLHQTGHFFHCDYSFILGQDPKTYLPMRITKDMVDGMGGHDSDNFALFLSLAGASFVALRQRTSVRILMSLVRNMANAHIPDISIRQSPENALSSMLQRFRLDLNDDEAVTFIEDNIERSITSKIWIAVDAIHSLGKKF